MCNSFSAEREKQLRNVLSFGDAGIDPGTSRMRSERSTIIATSPLLKPIA